MELKNKKILVTGADGFIGSHLVEALLDEGAQVRAFCFYNSFNHWGWLDTLEREKLDRIDIFMGDIRDPHGVRSALEGCQVVFHLAALIGIPFSYHSPDAYIDTNVKGTLNVLQAAKNLSLERVLITSTSEVYGTALYVPIDEKHPLQAQSPYSATKIAADKLAESFSLSFELPMTVVRPFNTYGPRQSARAVIPTIITQLLSGSQELKIGDLRPKRDLNYVKDVCQGFLAIARSDQCLGETINVASGSEISIKALVDQIIDLIPSAQDVKIISDAQRKRPAKSEVLQLLGCPDKIRSLTAWEPRYTFTEGLLETIQWIRDHLGQYKPEIYNV